MAPKRQRETKPNKLTPRRQVDQSMVLEKLMRFISRRQLALITLGVALTLVWIAFLIWLPLRLLQVA